MGATVEVPPSWAPGRFPGLLICPVCPRRPLLLGAIAGDFPGLAVSRHSTSELPWLAAETLAVTGFRAGSGPFLPESRPLSLVRNQGRGPSRSAHS